MINPAQVGVAVMALSACASGFCIVMAYHVPQSLRDGAERIGQAFTHAVRQDDDGRDDTPQP